MRSDRNTGVSVLCSCSALRGRTSAPAPSQLPSRFPCRSFPRPSSPCATAQPAQCADGSLVTSRRFPRSDDPSPKEDPATKAATVPAGKITAQIDPELLDQVRDAVVYLSGPPHRLTVRRMLENALRNELQRLQDEVLKGEQFPPRDEGVRTGRPVS